ncbi:hypothetical protein [Streptomyces chrestomyceticus]|uniref:hypothetical protein n=1 Tax=Streptomyces chrestomyceticus TaxID=68185 RepID=UPI0033FC6E29
MAASAARSYGSRRPWQDPLSCRTRVILEKTGTRPRVPRLVKRWLAGYGFLVLWLVMAVFDGADDPEDLCGVRMVRRRDLLSV